MSKFSQIKQGDLAMVRQTEDGRIQQIAMTVEQNDMLQVFLQKLSEIHPLVTMPEEYDLTLKNI